jgi:branched-chain amino acid transport system ATP-binding protein
VAAGKEPVLSALDVRMRFGALAVLDGVNLSLREGEVVGIVGPNGAGKTTLLSVLAGSLRPDAGTIAFRGRDITARDAAERCKLGIARTHQVPRPFVGMTVFENVLVGATAGGSRRGSEAYRVSLEVLDQCALAHLANRRAEDLGLLQRKRLELARALAVRPAVLLLDEIGGGLTDAEAAALVETVAGLRDRGIAVLWIEHIVHVLLQVVTRLVCMDEGRIIAEGEPEAVVAQAAVIDAYLGSRV